MREKKSFRVIKHQIRVLGVDDGQFTPHTKGTVIVVGVVFRGGDFLDGVMHTNVAIDGLDATEQLAKMVNNSPHRRQLRVIMLHGITLGGFNLVDIKALNVATGLPVLGVTRDKPDLEAVRAALGNLPNFEERWRIVQAAGEIFEVDCGSSKLFLELAGVSLVDAQRIVRLTSTRSCLPEPLRVAHLIASGITP